MWAAFINSKFCAWLVAIGSAIAMAYVLWTSSRRVQSAETRSADAIVLEKDKTKWNDEKAAMQVFEQTIAHEKAQETLVQALDTQARIGKMEDQAVQEQLKSKWMRTGE